MIWLIGGRLGTGTWGKHGFYHCCSGMLDCGRPRDMKRSRMHIFYSGHVQGVGFRYTVKSVAAGFEVVGTVKNLSDGRVELIAEGTKEELEAFQSAIRDAGTGQLIRNEDVSWGDAAGDFRGFEIVK